MSPKKPPEQPSTPQPGYGPDGGPKPYPEEEPRNRHERRKLEKMKRDQERQER